MSHEKSSGGVNTDYYPIVKPVLADYTWVNQGPATAVEINNGIAFSAPGVGGENIRLLTRAAPAAPYKFRVGILPTYLSVIFSYTQYGIGFRDSVSGKILAFCMSDALSPSICVTKFSSPTASVGTYILFTGTDYYSGSLMSQYPTWLQIEDDGTNHIYSVSGDGENWLEVVTVANTDFLAADEICFIADGNNAGKQIISFIISAEIL